MEFHIDSKLQEIDKEKYNLIVKIINKMVVGVLESLFKKGHYKNGVTLNVRKPLKIN